MLYLPKTIAVRINQAEYLISYRKQVVIPNIEYIISVKQNIPGLENGGFRFVWLTPTSFSYLDSDVITEREITIRNIIANTVLEDESQE
jgi:hypothetical protein